jgi:hypothetical protein
MRQRQAHDRLGWIFGRLGEVVSMSLFIGGELYDLIGQAPAGENPPLFVGECT